MMMIGSRVEGGEGYPSGIEPVRVPEGGVMRRIVASFVFLAAVAGLSACGNAPREVAEAAKASPTTSAPSAPPARYRSVTDLRDALISTGYDCPDWQRTDRVKLALQSGSCSSADVLSIYTGPEAVQAAVQQLKSISPDGVHLAVGENWIINTKQAEGVAAALGGVHVTG